MRPKNAARKLLCAAALALVAASAQASILFTPHLSEYAPLAEGSYADHTLVYTSIRKVYDANGQVIPLGAPFIPGGDSVDALLLLARYLWIGNQFADTRVPLLSTHKQIFRVIATAGWQQASGGAVDRSRLFGLTSGGSGIGDVYVLGGIYTHEHRWGPLQWNGLFSNTLKLPVGEYDTKALLNNGTHYWTTIPQIAAHAELYNRLIVDGTFAWQFNGRNDSPAYGGMTPTDPADVRNFEVNAAWKFSEKWFVDFGFFRRQSVGPNKFGKVTATFTSPQPATTACAALGIPAAQCSLTNDFRLVPVPGERQDNGIYQNLLSSSIYYVYRTSSVVDFRVSRPISGRGSQFPMDYDVALYSDPTQTPIPGTRQHVVLNGVQEAAAIPASPLFELRFVYLFWAP
ncbi:MAG TPA: transporter [Nevskiaceae bacterium]|nr:transporter [Nevskiaceae bacterium]